LTFYVLSFKNLIPESYFYQPWYSRQSTFWWRHTDC